MRSVPFVALLLGCGSASNPFGASLVIEHEPLVLDGSTVQPPLIGQVLVQVFPRLINHGSRVLPLAEDRFSVETPDGQVHLGRFLSDCGDGLAPGHDIQCNLEFPVPLEQALISAVRYQLPDGGSLRAPVPRQRCERCGGIYCVDLRTDATNCGACGVTGSSCTDGVPGCLPGATRCDGSCVLLRDDAKNCGSCGNECSADAVCESGACVIPDGCASSMYCHSCCLTSHRAGFDELVRLEQQCLCVPSMCGDVCAHDYCATGTFADPMCEACFRSSPCDVTSQCQSDPDCGAYDDCYKSCP